MTIRNRVLCALLLGCVTFSGAALAAESAGGKDSDVVLLPNGQLGRVPVNTQSSCGNQYVFPGTEGVDKFCQSVFMPECGGCAYDSNCTIFDNRGKAVGGTNRRVIDMQTRWCSKCPFDTPFCPDDLAIPYGLHFEHIDFGDCGRCQP